MAIVLTWQRLLQGYAVKVAVIGAVEHGIAILIAAVAMQNAFAVGGIERISHLDGIFQDQRCRQRTVADLVRQRLPFQQLHHDELLVIVLLDGVNGANVGVIQRRG